MKVFHSRVVRSAAANQGVILAVGGIGRLVAAATRNSNTGYRNIPMFAGPNEASYQQGVGATAGQLDPAGVIPLIPVGGSSVQAGVREWLAWWGSVPLGGDLVAVIFDITECVADDGVDCLAVVEQ